MKWRDQLLCGVLVIPFALGCSAGDDDDAAGTSEGSSSSSSVADSSSTSGPGESSSTGAAPVDYLTMVQPIWNMACTCHLQGPSGTMTATVLTLNEQGSYDQLVDVPAEQAPALDRIEPGDVAASYLIHKLDGTQADVGGSGTPMPQIGMLDEQQRATIDAWITQGAPP
jgi:hypothetical protein